MPADQIERLSSIRQGPLGRYFEFLIGALFTLSPEIEASHSNLVVRDGKATQGEFDLLYKKGGNWHHLEMAVKFYLGVLDRASGFNWHGPALRDSLGRKWTRMSEHQLSLPKTDAGRSVLQDLSIHNVESEALILGRLFHPLTDWQSNSLEIPPYVSTDHANGWWMHVRDVISFAHSNVYCWVPLIKHEWLAKKVIHTAPSRPNFKDINHPQMYAVFKQVEQNQYCEINRGFVVPNHWRPK